MMGVQVSTLRSVSFSTKISEEVLICCFSTCTVERTVSGKNPIFDDEPTLPKLNNLASHVTDCKKKLAQKTSQDSEVEDDDTPNSQSFNIKASADMMAAYLKRGELNPAKVPTQAGFLRLFSAWILDESLPWTTGEAPTLQILFDYLKINFHLPSDMTV